MKSKKTFEEIVAICYEEEYPELHKEVLSIQNGLEYVDQENDYIQAIGEVLEAIYTFATDFDQEKYYHIEEIYGELSEQL